MEIIKETASNIELIIKHKSRKTESLIVFSLYFNNLQLHWRPPLEINPLPAAHVFCKGHKCAGDSYWLKVSSYTRYHVKHIFINVYHLWKA